MSSTSSYLTCLVFLSLSLAVSQPRGIPTSKHLLKHHHHVNARCSRCPPGWGVATRCSPEADTQCQVCAPGTYSPHFSAVAGCWLCSRCGQGLYEAHPCTSRADTLCDGCTTVHGLHNGDFTVHCNLSSTFYSAVTEQPPPASKRVVHTVLAADELAPNMSQPAPPSDVINTVVVLRPTEDESKRPGLGVALVTTLLLVSAAGAACTLALRYLRSHRCTYTPDKELEVQEETLLQELGKPVEEADE